MTRSTESGFGKELKRPHNEMRAFPPALVLVIAVALLVHAILFSFDLGHPDAFTSGDRSSTRLIKIEQFVQRLDAGTGSMQYLAVTGGAGDFALHALVYAMGGATAVIVAQILLGLVSIGFVFALGVEIGLGQRHAALAALLYALLPASLYHPHVLVSEAIFNPFVVASIYFTVRMFNQHAGIATLIAAALTASIAIYVRFIFVLVPVGVAVLMMLGLVRHLRLRSAVLYLLLAFSLPAAWSGSVLLLTGQTTQQETDHDLGLNLYGRVARMARTGDFEPETVHQQRRRLTFREYTGYVMDHPGPYFRTLRSDLSNLMLNSGVNSLAGRYLGLYEVSDDARYWRMYRDEHGLVTMAREMWRVSPVLFLSNVGATFVWLLFTALAVLGLVVFMLSSTYSTTHKIILTGFSVYMLAASQAAISVRWGFRTPIEFVLVLAFVIGLASLTDRLRQRIRLQRDVGEA